MSTRTLIVKSLQRLNVNKVAHRFYYRYVHGFDAANRAVLPALERCFARVKETGTGDAGDYMEFGLFKGYTFWYAQDLANRHDLTSTRFFGFDSFQGLPDPGEVDSTRHEVFYEGQYCCSKAEVVRNLDAKSVDWSRTHLVEGFFDQTLVPGLKRRYGMRKAAIALVDCDLYESTRDVMAFLDDLIGDDTVLMLDDWNCFDRDDARGQRRAVREFLERSPGRRLEDWFAYGDYGQVFVVRDR